MGFAIEVSQKVLRFRLEIWYIPSAVTTSSSIRFLDRLNSSGRGNAGPSKELFLSGACSGLGRDSCRYCLSGLLKRLMNKARKKGPASTGPLFNPAGVGTRQGSFSSDFLRALRRLPNLLAGPESVLVHGSFLGPAR